MPRLTRRSLLLLALVCLLAPATPPAAAASAHAASWRPDVAAARRYARRRLGEVAFAVIDQRGREYDYRAATTAPAASVFKVMLLVSFLRMREGRGLSARGRALLAPMIRRSDSVAATEVRDLVGGGGSNGWPGSPACATSSTGGSGAKAAPARATRSASWIT